MPGDWPPEPTEMEIPMTCQRPTLTHERLQEILNYDPETGVFTWRISPRYGISPGDRAGAISGKGYRHIQIGGAKYRCNRLAWFFMKGEWPTHQIDHKNRNRTDDCFDNLRDATGDQNQWNTSAKRNSKTGIKGVYWHPKLLKFTADIRVNGRTKHLGVFETLAAAVDARNKAAANAHGEFFNA